MTRDWRDELPRAISDAIVAGHIWGLIGDARERMSDNPPVTRFEFNGVMRGPVLLHVRAVQGKLVIRPGWLNENVVIDASLTAEIRMAPATIFDAIAERVAIEIRVPNSIVVKTDD